MLNIRKPSIKAIAINNIAHQIQCQIAALDITLATSQLSAEEKTLLQQKQVCALLLQASKNYLSPLDKANVLCQLLGTVKHIPITSEINEMVETILTELYKGELSSAQKIYLMYAVQGQKTHISDALLISPRFATQFIDEATAENINKIFDEHQKTLSTSALRAIVKRFKMMLAASAKLDKINSSIESIYHVLVTQCNNEFDEAEAIYFKANYRLVKNTRFSLIETQEMAKLHYLVAIEMLLEKYKNPSKENLYLLAKAYALLSGDKTELLHRYALTEHEIELKRTEIFNTLRQYTNHTQSSISSLATFYLDYIEATVNVPYYDSDFDARLLQHVKASAKLNDRIRNEVIAGVANALGVTNFFGRPNNEWLTNKLDIKIEEIKSGIPIKPNVNLLLRRTPPSEKHINQSTFIEYSDNEIKSSNTATNQNDSLLTDRNRSSSSSDLDHKESGLAASNIWHHTTYTKSNDMKLDSLHPSIN